MHCREISATLVQLNYGNIMITFVIDLVQHFYVYWQIQDNQEVLFISFKNDLIPFYMKLFQKGKFLFWALANRLKLMSHTYR